MGDLEKNPFLHQRGVSLLEMMVASLVGVVAIFASVQYFDMQNEFVAMTERRFFAMDQLKQLRQLLSDPTICSANFADVDPLNNSNWPTGGKKLTSADGSLIYLKEGEPLNNIKVESVDFVGFKALASTAPGPPAGLADLRIVFDLGKVTGARQISRTIRIRANLKGAAVPGQENQIASCGALNSNLPVCDAGNTLVSDGNEFQCSKDLAITGPIHYDVLEMPCVMDAGASQPLAFGNKCATYYGPIDGLDVDLTAVNPATNPNVGVLAYQFNYVPKTSGAIKVNVSLPWRAQPAHIEHAILAAIYADGGTGQQLLGAGLLANPMGRYVDPSNSSNVAGVPWGDVGGDGSIIGFFKGVAGTNYTISIRLYRKTEGSGGEIWAGTMRFDDQNTMGLVEIMENSI